MSDHDFFEGVRCLLFDKGSSPKWKHNSIFEVTDSEVDIYFEQLPDYLELKLPEDV